MCSMEGLVIERFGAGDVTGPALLLLKRVWLDTLKRSEATARRQKRALGRASGERTR